MSQPPPEGNGAALAMKKALELSGLSPEDIQYISAHGTSTPLGDLAETTAIKAIFGSHSQKLAVSSIKGHIGHLLGAAGIVQTISTIKSIQDVSNSPVTFIIILKIKATFWASIIVVINKGFSKRCSVLFTFFIRNTQIWRTGCYHDKRRWQTLFKSTHFNNIICS